MECNKCRKATTNRTQFKCQDCKGIFHKSCIKGLVADLKAGKTRRFCANCDGSDGVDGDSEPEDLGESANSSANSTKRMLAEINKKVDAIKDVKNQLNDLTASVDFLADKYEKLLHDYNEAKSEWKKAEKTLTNKCIYLEKCNGALEERISEMEQAVKQNSLEIVGVEKIQGEDLTAIVSKIADKLKVSSDKITKSTRGPPAKKDSPPPIMVWFSEAEARDSWWAGRPRRSTPLISSTITGGQSSDSVYVNENLTKHNKSLLWSVKQHKDFIKYVWVSGGRVLARKTDGAKVIWIRNEGDVAKLSVSSGSV